MAHEAVPVIDLSPYFAGGRDGKLSVARAVDSACREVGFLVISGHGVSSELVSEMRRVSRAYFERPLEEKLTRRMPADRYRGYTPMGTEGLAATLNEVAPPDLKESFSIGPVDVSGGDYFSRPAAGNFFAANLWPEKPAEFQSVWTQYYREMERLSGALMRIFALALDLPENWFDSKVDRHITNFSVIHYPEQRGEPAPGQLRAGAHTDYGSLTILQKDDAPGGLQIRGRDGTWIDAPHVTDSFVVNLGDLMAEWTNDRWRSTLHRVVNPPTASRSAADRISMAFFHQPNYDAVVECIPGCCSADNPPKYGRTTSGEHVRMKIAKHRGQIDVDETVAH